MTLTTVPVLLILLGLLSCTTPAPKPALSLTQDQDGITIQSGETTVLAYHLATQYPPDSLPDYYQRSGFIHPLNTPKGKGLTSAFPKGHVHQHALFYALTNTTFRGQFTDFWNQQKETGTIRAKAITHSFRDSEAVGFSSLQEHLALQEGDTIVAMEERWEVSVSQSAPFNVIDLSSFLYMAGNDSIIVKKYLYGGLGFRGHEEWNDHGFKQPQEGEPVNYIGKAGKGGFLTSEGMGRIDGNHSRPEWVSFHGQAEGDSIGMVLLDHPSNFRFPQPIRIHPDMPYFSVSPMVLDSFVIHPGDTLVSRYRILTHDGTPPLEKIKAEWEHYKMEK